MKIRHSEGPNKQMGGKMCKIIKKSLKIENND